MTNTATKTYRIGVIERAIAYYEVEADDARTAAENWQDGEFSDRDDEALESEGPCNVREQQPDGTWQIIPPSQWEHEQPATDVLPPTSPSIEITEDEFDSRFPLVTNHLNPNASWCLDKQGGCLFETYGEELEFVRQQDPSTVWTLVDGDDSDQYLLSGFHFVNRIGYLISTVPVPEGTEIQVHIPMENPDDAETAEAEEE